METFLKDYVRMLAEIKGITLTRKQVKNITIDLENNDHLWDIIDSEVNSRIDQEVK